MIQHDTPVKPTGISTTHADTRSTHYLSDFALELDFFFFFILSLGTYATLFERSKVLSLPLRSDCKCGVRRPCFGYYPAKSLSLAFFDRMEKSRHELGCLV